MMKDSYSWDFGMIDKSSDITEVKFGNCNDVYVRKGNNKQSNPWFGWKNNGWKIV